MEVPDRPDFLELGKKYPEFAKYVTIQNEHAKLDFKDPLALRELSRVLLKEYFQLTVDMPADQLIPTVNSRLSYVRWIASLLEMGRPSGHPPDVRGIDIGTGATAVYALLAARIYGWHMLATDIVTETIEYACKNVAANGLERRVTVRHVDDAARVLADAIGADADADKDGAYDFCMCNPPFYESSEQMTASYARATPPVGVNTGAAHEVVVDGGEVRFVERIIQDSLALRTRITWYTSLVGRKASLYPLLKTLKHNHVTNVRFTAFTHGKTTRWALAWSFTDIGEAALPPLSHRYHVVSPNPNPGAKSSPRPDKVIRVSGVADPAALLRTVCDALARYDIAAAVESHVTCEVSAVARRNTWSRKARRGLDTKDALAAQQDAPAPVWVATFQVVADPKARGECHVAIRRKDGDLDQLHAFELHFARYLAEHYTLPDMPQDLAHARTI